VISAQNRSRPSRARGAIRGALLTALLVLGLSASAHAEVPNHPFLGALISGLQPEPKPLRPKLETPCGVAVNPAGGATYVSDYIRHSILGATLPEFFPNNGPCALASDGTNLYVNYWHGAVVNLASAALVDPGRSTGIALDPISKNLYVDQGSSIAVYEAPVEPNATPAQVIGTGTLIDGYGVAVSDFGATAGYVYAADAATNTIKVYNPATSLITPIKVIEGTASAAGRFVSLKDASLALDQSNGHLFVVDNTQPGFEHPLAAVDEFNVEGIFRGQLEHEIIDGEPTGIAIDESATINNGDVYVTSGNGSSIVIPPALGPPASEQGALYAFGPAGPGQTLKVSTSGPGQGAVKSDPAGISCPGACQGEFNSGAVVTLSATPAPGSAFAGWSGASCPGTGTCQVIPSGGATVNAEFILAPPPQALAASASASAEAAAEPAGAAPPSPAPGSLILGKADALKDGSVLVVATAPGPGTLTAAAKGLEPARASLAQAGRVGLRLRLSRAGRRVLAKSKTGHLAMAVAISFKPSLGGGGSVIRKTVTFKQRSRGR
jgi:DNA-binding beta-propeller fold protein YncE